VRGVDEEAQRWEEKVVACLVWLGELPIYRCQGCCEARARSTARSSVHSGEGARKVRRR
jgi:hypothetical protein